MTQEQKLEQFIDAIGLRYFKGSEFTYYWSAVRNGVKNSIPPENLWPNIVKTLVVADKLREITGSPLRVTSSYRSPAYNAAIPGAASGSVHMSFKALDLIPSKCDPEDLFKAALKLRGTKIQMPNGKSSFTFRGGIGRYSSFVHIDTRGYDATW